MKYGKGCSNGLIKINTKCDRAVCSGVPTVAVLLSTYNGSKYIEEQLSSIVLQKSVDLTIWIRDDGSSDDTAGIAESFLQEHGARFNVVRGSNIGYRNSFDWLMANCCDADYYAFSDQDDVWELDKLTRAIAEINRHEEDDVPVLYASAVRIVDENLEDIGFNGYKGFRYSIPSEFMRHRLSGHTMVWGRAMHKRYLENRNLSCWSHDQQMVLASLMGPGKLVLDSSSYVMHRRLRNSVTPGGAGLKKRIAHELKLMLNSDEIIGWAPLAGELLRKGDIYSEIDSTFLQLAASVNDSWPARRKLMAWSYVSCGIPLADLECRISLMLNRL